MTKQLLTKECDVDRRFMPLPFDDGLGAFVMGAGRDLCFTHPGSNLPGSLCFLVGWPERGTGAVVMTNGPGLMDGFLMAMGVAAAVDVVYNR